MPEKFKFETELTYETAGVRFQLSLQQPAAGTEAFFDLSVRDLSGGDRVPFRHDASPAIHDFTRGYTRWLATKGIQAERGGRLSPRPRARRLFSCEFARCGAQELHPNLTATDF